MRCHWNVFRWRSSKTIIHTAILLSVISFVSPIRKSMQKLPLLHEDHEGKLMISKVIKEGSCFCRACNSELATNLLKTELANSNFQAYVLHYMFFWSQNYCENQTLPNPCNTYFCYWKHALWDSKSYTGMLTIQFLRLWNINLFFCLLKRDLSAGHARAK